MANTLQILALISYKNAQKPKGGREGEKLKKIVSLQTIIPFSYY